MVKPVPADGTSLRVCWSHLRAGPFPSELWEVLLLSFSTSFSSAAVHNHTPHPSPVSVDGTQHLYHTGGVRTTRLCSGRECTRRLAFHPRSCLTGVDVAVSSGLLVDVLSDISVFVRWSGGLLPPEPAISGDGRTWQTQTLLLFQTSRLLCPAAVLWCSGSHIYGVSEGQRRLLPGSARCLCRRVKRQPRHPSHTLEPPEGRLPEPALTRPGWGNSTRCTLPLSASAWPESRWNQPCFSFFLPFLSFYSKEEGF